MRSLNLKPEHKAVTDYYAEIEKLGGFGQVNEGQVAPVFSQLLKHCARQFDYTLIEQYSDKINGRDLRYDGLLVDEFKLHHGIWEAKDTKDKLDVEIKKKFEKGYPNKNIMFQDPKRIIVYQNGKEVFGEDVTKPEKLIEALKIFFDYEQPIIEDFHKAVEQFKQEIPKLAEGLQAIIDEEQARNIAYQKAFTDFTKLCQKSINPNIAEAALEEMLIQHLLTERLFRTVFKNPDFVKRNAIAVEIEKVIDAMTSRAFDRSKFTEKLDRFYRAIEEAAKDITDWNEMQAFMNTVYEKFFQGFAIKVADTHGIVYTPQPIVNFMVRSVEDILQREFGRSLSDPGVHILDPFVGTGNFIVNIMKAIRQTALPNKYASELHCNEVMLLPYYVACMNIEHEYYEKTGEYKPFEGICFVDTFQLAEPEGNYLFSMTEKNTERVEKQKNTPIFVIISNPPYNAGQVNENDNNKNRKYPVIDKRVAETYAKDSKATLVNTLNDPYVKAIRWATDRINANGEGIVAVVTNNSFINDLPFDGMRKHLEKDFDAVYTLDLGGNVRKNPKLSGTTHNVFGIQVGVSINFFIKKNTSNLLPQGEGAQRADEGALKPLNSSNSPSPQTPPPKGEENKPQKVFYARLDEFWKKEQKYVFLDSRKNSFDVDWQELTPDKNHTWLTEGLSEDFESFISIGNKESKRDSEGLINSIFKTYSRGICTNGDTYNYNFNKNTLSNIAKRMIENYNSERFRWLSCGSPKDLESFLRVDEKSLKWIRHTKLSLLRNQSSEYDSKNIQKAVYRPFIKTNIFLDRIFNEDLYHILSIFPINNFDNENSVISVTNHSQILFNVLMLNAIPDLCVGGRNGQCFPYFIYNKDGSGRRENITDWALDEFRKHYNDSTPQPPLKKGGLDGVSSLPPLLKGGRGVQNSSTGGHREITKWDIFYYVYGLLHHPAYRKEYEANLKRELPRIPFAPDFWAFSDAGKKLAELHVNYESQAEYPLKMIENPDKRLDWRVEKMRLSKDKRQLIYNDFLTLDGIPEKVFGYKLGNRSALDWIIDQYQVTTDKRSGITNDPNRDDEPDYIVKLIKKIVTVSIQTVTIVESLEKLDYK